ncbi:MAG: NAD-dependent epimerase/dehydratase family protein [Gemmataceae bacterium]
MRVLVSGASGFLGAAVVRCLVAHGHFVRATGRHLARLHALASLCEPLPSDLHDPASLRTVCADCEVVVHCAALSAPWGPRRLFWQTNVVGTQNLLAACLYTGVRRFIHLSSPSVLFTGRDVHLATEQAPYARHPLCAYAWSKQLAEQHVRHSPLDWLILRPKAIFGPGDTSLLPRIVSAAQAGRLPMVGSGKNLIDLTYVDNVAHAIALAVRSSQRQRIYHVTNDEHVPLWPLIARVLTHFGLPLPRWRLPLGLAMLIGRLSEGWASLLGGEPRLTRYTAALLGTTQTYDIMAIKRDLNYHPLISVDDAVEHTLNSWTEPV